MTQARSIPLTEDELEQLEELLVSDDVPADCMNLEMLDGYLAAIVAAAIILASLTELGIFVEVRSTEAFAEIEVKAYSLNVVGGKLLGGGSR